MRKEGRSTLPADCQLIAVTTIEDAVFGRGVLRNYGGTTLPTVGQLIIVVATVKDAVVGRGVLRNDGGTSRPPVCQLVVVATVAEDAVLFGALCVTPERRRCDLLVS